MRRRIFRPGESDDYKARLKQVEEVAGVSQEGEDDTEEGDETIKDTADLDWGSPEMGSYDPMARALEKIHDTIVTLENSGLTEDERDEGMDRLINEVDLFRELYPDKPLPDEVNKYLPDEDN